MLGRHLEYVYDLGSRNIYLASTTKFIDEGYIYDRHMHNNILAKKLWKHNVYNFFENVTVLNIEGGNVDVTKLMYFNKNEQISCITEQVQSAETKFANIKNLFKYLKQNLYIEKSRNDFLMKTYILIEIVLSVIFIFAVFTNVLIAILTGLLTLVIIPILMHGIIEGNKLINTKIKLVKDQSNKVQVDEFITGILNGESDGLEELLQELKELNEAKITKIHVDSSTTIPKPTK